MTLSSKSFRWRILPSILVASLALSACQDSISSHEKNPKESAKTINNKADDSSITSHTDVATDDPTADTVSPEQKMIANLSNYRWTLTSAVDSKTRPLSTLMSIKDQVRLSFNQYQGQNTVSYSVGCNTISAVYELQGLVLTVEDSMSTKMSCGELDVAENSLVDLMQGDSQLVLAEDKQSSEDQPILTQLTSEATTLVWKGNLTARAKYNSTGETIFWAVNNKKIPCDATTSEMCLQIKPVTYDDQGIKSSEGEWSSFAGVIDGYQHDSEHDEVLRLQRYQLDTNAMTADKPENISDEAYAYVLDAVIESSVAEQAAD